jgi:hypothetical protein
MIDATRDPAEPQQTGEDKARTIDALLVAGLDRYFAGDYERAIHAWTRVLFLDRSHPRARAYIERARAVLAERHRETDELLHRGLAALDAGDTTYARSLLASAVERGGPVEAAEAALERLVRLDVAAGPEPAGARDPSGTASRVLDEARRGSRRFVAVTLAAASLAAAASAVWFGVTPLAPLARDDRRVPAVAPRRADAPLPRASMAMLSLRRSRELFSRGHLHEALTELDGVRIDDVRRPEADRLRADIQRALLDAADVPPAADARAPTPGRP